MPFCPSCGTAVEGRFCAKCGTAVGAAPAANAAPPAPGYAQAAPPPPTASAGLDENVACALSYIFPVAIVFLLIEPYNRMRNVRFHAFQSLFLAAAWIVLSIGLGIFRAILRAILPYSLWTLVGLYSLLTSLIYLAIFVLWVVLLIKAYQNQKFVLPVIGAFAEKQA
jgi:uncharacterized membrane protein